ncbi:hypothetical protein [Sulfitobacter geojensis]|uniref:hypothetical protein n=1 Tax=Sulfitobacter geojensis TaxID=1342299 RepID=UPI003B8BFBAA
MNNLDEAIAFRTQSNDYLTSAKNLVISVEKDQIRLRGSDPIDQLVGHAFELSLKSKALREHEGIKVTKYSHNVLKLFDHLQKQNRDLNAISAIIATRWRERLTRDRQILIAKFGDYAVALTELGLPTADDVDTLHYFLRNDVAWYSERMTSGGSLFRYHQTRMDIIPQIGFWGINYHRPRQSLIWATEIMNA